MDKMTIRPVFWITCLAVILCFSAATFRSHAQTLDASDLHPLLMASVAERVFLLKSAENILSDKAEKIFGDRENAKDGYLWARKTVASYYFSLAKNAAELQVPELAGIYISKASIISRQIKGEITSEELLIGERNLEKSKSEFLHSVLINSPKNPSIPISQLSEKASAMASKIHAIAATAALE